MVELESQRNIRVMASMKIAVIIQLRCATTPLQINEALVIWATGTANRR